MKLTIEHNLPPEVLTKAIASLADAQGIAPSIIEALQKAACDDEPKEPRQPAVAHLYRQFMQEYDKARDDLMEIVRGGLKKSIPVMTHGQIRTVMQAIKDRFGYLAAQMQTDYIPTADELERWKALGLVPPETTAATFASLAGPDSLIIHNAFLMGKLWEAVESGTSYPEVITAAHTIPLLKPDMEAIAVAEQQAAIGIQNFAGDLATEIGRKWAARQNEQIRQTAIDFHARKLQRQIVDREKKEALGLDTTPRLVENWQQAAQELQQTMEDKARDWQRVAFTEITDSQKQGQAHALLSEIGPDGWVYKRPMPTACSQCRYLYLEPDSDTPKLFRLKDMIAAGNNIGRKAMPTRGGKVKQGYRDDGQPVLQAVAGTVHPYCQCQGPFPINGHEPWLTDEQKEQIKKAVQLGLFDEPLHQEKHHRAATIRHTASGAAIPVRETQATVSTRTLHPSLQQEHEELKDKVKTWHQDPELAGEKHLIGQALQQMEANDPEAALKTMRETDAKYKFSMTMMRLEDHAADAQLDREAGLEWGTKPGKLVAWRSGDIRKQKNGLFFSPNEEGAKAYAEIGDMKRETHQYQVEIKNPLVARNMIHALAELTGVPVTKIVDQRDRAKDQGKFWVSVDSKVVSEARKQGYDAITYTRPAAPAIRELQIISPESVQLIKAIQKSHHDATTRHYASGATGQVRAYDDRRQKEYQLPQELQHRLGIHGVHVDQGHNGYGLKHIEIRHGEELREAGYPTPAAFVDEVLKNCNVAYKLDGNRIALVDERNGQQKIHIVEADRTDKDYLTVVTAYIADRMKFHPKKNAVLWRKLMKALRLLMRKQAA